MTEDNALAALAYIRDGLTAAEAGIHEHPSDTVAVYESNITALGRQSFDWATRTVPSMSIEDARLVDRYMLAMAFISAWYHLHGDKAERDTAAQSAASLVRDVGFDDTFAFKAILHYEGEWRRLLRAAGIARPTGSGCASVLLVLAAGGGVLALSFFRA